MTAEAEPAVMKPQPRGARGHPELEGAKRGKTPRLGAFGGSGARGGGSSLLLNSWPPEPRENESGPLYVIELVRM